jgi:DNA-binding transcriptional LysR family regulator
MLKTTLEQWRMLKAVIDYGGFKQASERIHKSQSSIHHAVHKLEELLDVKLLQNDGKRVKLTSHGELLLRRGNYLIQEATKIEAIANSLNMGVEANLRLAIDCAFPQHLLYNVLQSVSSQYPFLCVQVIETVLSGANELITSADADVAISPIAFDEGLNDEICQVEFICVSSSTHALQKFEEQLSYEDLKPHRQIVVRDSANQNQLDQGWLEAEQRWTVSHIRTSIELVSKGLGYAWLPKPEIEKALNQGVLLPVKLKQGSTRQVSFYINFTDAESLGPAAKSFIYEIQYKTTMPGKE